MVKRFSFALPKQPKAFTIKLKRATTGRATKASMNPKISKGMRLY